MSRLRAATETNQDASRQIQRQLLWKIRGKADSAGSALKEAHQAEPARVLAKLAEFVQAHREIDQLTMELAGAAILGGMTAAQVAEATGISTATLTRRMPKTMTALRGRNLVRDTGALHGWREQ